MVILANIFYIIIKGLQVARSSCTKQQRKQGSVEFRIYLVAVPGNGLINSLIILLEYSPPPLVFMPAPITDKYVKQSCPDKCHLIDAMIAFFKNFLKHFFCTHNLRRISKIVSFTPITIRTLFK